MSRLEQALRRARQAPAPAAPKTSPGGALDLFADSTADATTVAEPPVAEPSWDDLTLHPVERHDAPPAPEVEPPIRHVSEYRPEAEYRSEPVHRPEPEAPHEPMFPRAAAAADREARPAREERAVARHGGFARDDSQAATRLSRSLTGKVILGEEAAPVTVEQYRRLAAALHHAQADTGIKIVMVASALANEGKTLTAINLALTLAESYQRRVLLIDADLRRPTLHQAFQLSNASGLSDGLKADIDDDHKLTIAEITPRLSVLPAGKPDSDPMSGLTSGRMSRVLEEAAAKYDWVILDTPPVGLITDAHLLSAMAHVAVLVVRAGRTPVALVQRAIESLDRNRVIGVVLNCVEPGAMTPAGKYGKYYKSYYTSYFKQASPPQKL